MFTNKTNLYKNELNYIKTPSRKLEKIYIKNVKTFDNAFKKCNKKQNEAVFRVTKKSASLPFDYIVVRKDGIFICGLLHAMGEFGLQDPLTNKVFEFDAFCSGEIMYDGYNPYYEMANTQDIFEQFLISKGALNLGGHILHKVISVAVRLDNTTHYDWNTGYSRPVLDKKVGDIQTFLNRDVTHSVMTQEETSRVIDTLKTLPLVIQLI